MPRRSGSRCGRTRWRLGRVCWTLSRGWICRRHGVADDVRRGPTSEKRRIAMEQSVRRIIAEHVKRAALDWSVDQEGISTVAVRPDQAEACRFSVAWSEHEGVVGLAGEARTELGQGEEDLTLLGETYPKSCQVECFGSPGATAAATGSRSIPEMSCRSMTAGCHRESAADDKPGANLTDSLAPSFNDDGARGTTPGPVAGAGGGMVRGAVCACRSGQRPRWWGPPAATARTCCKPRYAGLGW